MVDAATYAASVNPNREIIRFKDFVLYPEGNGVITAKPTKVLFIKGLPKLMSEMKLRILFTEFGPIFALNKGKEDECTIEYFDHHYAQKATCLADYTIKLGNKDEDGYVGYLKMTYLTPVDDLPSPSKKAFKMLYQKLNNLDTLSEGTEMLETWIEDGKFNAKNMTVFHSLLVTAFKTSKRLLKNKNRCNEQVKVIEAKYRKSIAESAIDLKECGRIFNHKNYDKMVDAFPEEEKKSILQLKEEFIAISQEIGDKVPHKKRKKRTRKKQKKQNSTLRDVSPHESSSTESFSNRTVDEIFHSERLELLAEKEELQLQLDTVEADREYERAEHAARCCFLNHLLFQAHEKIRAYEAKLADNNINKKVKNPDPESDKAPEYNEASNLSTIDAHLISGLTSFLEKRQQGATLNDIYSHLTQKEFRVRYIVDLMCRFPTLFKKIEDAETGIVKWVFVGAKEQCA